MQAFGLSYLIPPETLSLERSVYKGSIGYRADYADKITDVDYVCDYCAFTKGLSYCDVLYLPNPISSDNLLIETKSKQYVGTVFEDDLDLLKSQLKTRFAINQLKRVAKAIGKQFGVWKGAKTGYASQFNTPEVDNITALVTTRLTELQLLADTFQPLHKRGY